MEFSKTLSFAIGMDGLRLIQGALSVMFFSVIDQWEGEEYKYNTGLLLVNNHDKSYCLLVCHPVFCFKSYEENQH